MIWNASQAFSNGRLKGISESISSIYMHARPPQILKQFRLLPFRDAFPLETLEQMSIRPLL